MSQFFLFLILITSPIIMLSGFAMSVFGSLLILVLFYEIVTRDNTRLIDFQSIINNYKLEITFAIWSLVSLISTVSSKSEIVLSGIKIFSFTYFFLLLKYNIQFNNENKNLIYEHLKFSIIFAIIIFFIEFFSNGSISRFLNVDILKKQTFVFGLNNLDRGCDFLTLCYWVLCKFLIDKKQYVAAILFYNIILFLLTISDCLAGLVAFISGGIIFLSVFSNKLFTKIITYLLLLGSLSFPVILGFANPHYIVTKFNKLPLSAKERIFIWNFVANKAMEHPIKGIGINNSRYINIPKIEMPSHEGHMFSQFQLHPHNNILQILFELGIIGFIISLLLMYKYVSRIHDPSTYAAFINYYVIGMISYSMWQSWWFICGIWIYSILQLSNNRKNQSV